MVVFVKEELLNSNNGNIGYNDINRLEYEISEFRNTLIKQYGEYVNKDILKTYLPYEKAIVVNDDPPDLYPIKIELPEPPELHKIDGFGLPCNEQYFRPPQMPKKLVDLRNSSTNEEEIWDKIFNNNIIS